jgi:hypothetical protein
LAAAALIVPVLAILSRLTPEILEFFGAEILQSRRLLYPLGYWNAVGAWSAMALAVALAYSVNPRGGGWRVASLALTPFAGLAVYLTYSRGSIVAAILALAMTIYLSRDRRAATIHCATAVFATGLCVLAVRSQPEVANATGEGGALLVLLVVLATSAGCAWVATRSGERGFTRGRQIGRWGPALAVALVCSGIAAIAIGGTGAASQPAGEPQQYPSEGSDPAARLASLDSNRYDIWSSGARAFQSDPLLGVGAGSFEFWWNRDGSGVESVRDAHSLYIETAAELGIPGIIGLLGFLGAVLYGAAHELRRSRSSGDASAFTAMVSAYVIFLVFAGFDWLWEIPAITLFGVSAGVIAAAADSSPRRTRSAKLSGRQLAAVAAAVLAGVALIPNLVATQRVRASSAELAIADYDGAIGEASEGVDAAPWAATSYAQRSLAEVAQGDLAAARADTEAAIHREPTNWKHWGLFAEVSALQGKKGEALDALETARDLSPLPDEFFDAAAARIDTSTDEDTTP